jgi:hypothetical protein
MMAAILSAALGFPFDPYARTTMMDPRALKKNRVHR